MRLRLVLKGPERLTAGLREKTVETGALVIGRSEEADWVLSDPERVVSKRHCRIERQAGGFFLTDMSTNGVLINGVPLGREATRMLVDRDVLTLGDAIIAVAIETGTPVQEVTTTQVVVPAGDPFAEGPFGFDGTVEGAAATAIVPETATENARGKVAVLQDWWIPEGKGAHGDLKSAEIPEGTGLALNAQASATDVAAAAPVAAEAALVAEAQGLDVTAFAGVVEMAMSVLSMDEKQRFEGRLRELLRKEKVG